MTLRAQIDLLTPEDLRAGIALSVIENNPALELLPARYTDTKYEWNKENALATASAIDIDTGTITPNALTYSRESVSLKAIVSQVKQPTFNRQNSEAAISSAIARELSKAYGRYFITGDSNANAEEFDGLERITTVNSTDDVSTVPTNGESFSIANMRKLYFEMKDGVSFYAMHRDALSRYLALAIAEPGGSTEQMVIQGQNFFTFHGSPIFTFDAIATDVDQGTATDTTSIYAVKVSPDEFSSVGLCGIYSSAFPMGMQLRDLGSSETTLHDHMRGEWYTALVAHNDYAVMRLKGQILA